MQDEKVGAKDEFLNSSFRLHPSSMLFGGGVWESNPPAPALTGALTVLKTAPFTRTDAPPREKCEDGAHPTRPVVRLSSRSAVEAKITRAGGYLLFNAPNSNRIHKFTPDGTLRRGPRLLRHHDAGRALTLLLCALRIFVVLLSLAEARLKDEHNDHKH